MSNDAEAFPSPPRSLFFSSHSNAAQLYKESKNTTKRLTKAVAALLVIMLALVGTIVGLTAHVIEAAKETKIANGGQMVTPDGTAVATGTNELDLPLATLLFLPDDVVSKVQRLQFTGDEGGMYYKHVRSIHTVADKSLEITTLEGDTMTWVTGTDDLKIKLANGETWTKPASCTKCSFVNVAHSAEVDAAMEKTIEALGSAGKQLSNRQLLGFSCW